MPTYEYVCRSCGEHLEVVQSFKDDALTTCPGCQGELRKVFSAAGLIFKGSGWHVKDYATSSRSSASSSSETGEGSKESAASAAKDSSSGKDSSAGKDSASGKDSSSTSTASSSTSSTSTTSEKKSA